MNTMLILSIIATAVSIIILFLCIFMYRKVKKLLQAKDKDDLIKLLDSHFQSIDIMKKKYMEIIDELDRIGIMSQRSFQHIGFERYNPFDDAGGNQSFSICLLDGDHNGVIISSLHSREGTRMYSKSVVAAESSHSLSEEERRVLLQALSRK